MIKPGKFVLRLTLRLELYINFVIVPMSQYFSTTSRQRSKEEAALMLVSSLFATVLMIILGTSFRAVVLSRLLRSVSDEKSDKEKVKLRILNYPRIEALIVSFRWFFGLLIPFIVMHYTYSLTLQQLLSFVFIFTMAVTANSTISFFATENMLSRVLETEAMASVSVPKNSYKEVGISFRLLVTVISILIMPMITLGYMLFIVNTGLVKYDNFARHIIVIIILSGIALTVLMYEATNGIRRSMKMTIDSLESLARGEFSAKSLPMLDRSELGTITRFINVLAASMSGYVKKSISLNRQLNALTDELTGNSESLSNNTREQATSMEEIMATTEEISSGAESTVDNIEEQLSSMDSLLDSMNKLSGVMADIEGRVKSVIELSGEIENRTGAGVSTLNIMIESLKVVSESSAKMSGITEIINDISDKINLLSLNASIEAARAGDAGKGFAVVAEEVSKLADMTANSIKDISSLVKSNMDEIQEGMRKIDETVITIENITKLVSQINIQTGDISSQMKSQNDLNGTVNSEAINIKDRSNLVKIAMNEQKNAINEISRTVAHITEATQINVASAENLYNKAREVDKMAAGLVKESLPDM